MQGAAAHDHAPRESRLLLPLRPGRFVSRRRAGSSRLAAAGG